MQRQADTPLLTDALLAELAAPNAQASLGEWDDKTRALLAVAVPELAANELKRRAADRGAHRRHTKNVQSHVAAQSLRRARALVRAPDPIAPRDLIAACRTLLMLSRDAAERAAAQDIITEMETAA